VRCVGVVKAVPLPRPPGGGTERAGGRGERQIGGKRGCGARGGEFGVELSANEGTEAGGRG